MSKCNEAEHQQETILLVLWYSTVRILQPRLLHRSLLSPMWQPPSLRQVLRRSDGCAKVGDLEGTSCARDVLCSAVRLFGIFSRHGIRRRQRQRMGFA